MTTWRTRSPSYLEAKARRLFRRAGLPEPIVELKWGDHGQSHSSPRARQYDLHRRNRIVVGELRPLIYTYGDIVRRGDMVISDILGVIARASPVR